MKYAALIFGDDDRHQPKKAAEKSSPEPGQIVRSINGSVYRVASKIAGPDGSVVKLANLQGKSVQTPQNFRPVGIAVARFASWLKYHLAYQKDFDLYVNAYIEQYNNQHKDSPLPYPMGQDGKAFRWANFFQKKISPKLYVRGHGNAEDQQVVKDDIIHEMLFNTLGERHVLDQFVAKAKKLGVNKQNAAGKLTDFLISTFMYRIDEMQNKLNARSPEEEISMWQPGSDDDWSGQEQGDKNILEQEEYGTGQADFQSAEARKDVARFRESFRKYLAHTAGPKASEAFILMFDIFWRLLQADESGDIKRNELQEEWMEKTGLSFGSFKDYFSRLPEMMESFITSHATELGEGSIFVDLMNTIRAERGERERKERRQKQKARPAMVSSLHIAEGVEEDFAEAQKNTVSPLKVADGIGNDLAQAISNSENPDVVDPDIKQPTESPEKFAAIGEGWVSGENVQGHRPGYNPTPKEKRLESLNRLDEEQGTDWMAQDLKRRYPQTFPANASSKIAQNLVRGEQLNPQQKQQVINAFPYRWTWENPHRVQRECGSCDVRNDPFVGSSAQGHNHPTIPLQHDDEWVKEHAFWFTNAGKLFPRRGAVPASYAPESEPEGLFASVAHRFAMEKTRKQADFACCGGFGEHDANCSVKGTGSVSKEGMLGHDFNNADGQAINDETNPDTGRYNHESDTTELKQRRIGSHEIWECMDCGQKGEFDPKGGTCATCGSQAIARVDQSKPADVLPIREPNPLEVEKRMIPRREKMISPAGADRLSASDKTAQGSGGTTVTMQNQNVTNPNVPGKSEPMAVPEAIDQQAGPHSPNAPMTAPRTPGITPKIVNVPPGTEGESMGNMASAKTGNEFEEMFGDILSQYACPHCQSVNVDVTPTEDGYDIYCEDCERVTPSHGGATPGVSGFPATEPEFVDPDLEMEPEEPPFEHQHEGAEEKTADALFEEQPIQDVTDLDMLFSMPQERKEEWLVAHGWVKDESWHGASWWMQQPMWTKDGREEDIPYQETDNAIEKEVELMGEEDEDIESKGIGCRQCGAVLNNGEGDLCPQCQAEGAEDREDPFDKEGAGSNSGGDDARGAGDNWREEFYEHRTKGLSSEGMLSGMKGASFIRTAAISVSQGQDDQGFHMLLNMNGREYVLRGADADTFRREYAAIPKPEGKVNALVEKYMNKLQPYGYTPKPRPQAPAKPKREWGIPAWLKRKQEEEAQSAVASDKTAAPVALNAPAPAPISPNVQQNMNLVRPQMPTAPGGTEVAISPGQGGSGQEDTNIGKHTVEPELPNSKYHMMGSLIATEERRIAAEMGLEVDEESEANPEMFTMDEKWKWVPRQGSVCRECQQPKPDLKWHVYDEFSDLNPERHGKDLEGWFCDDCALEIAQDI